MAQKLSKKGRNPGAVDNWLEALGYYRKNVAYDETCLFRAVSEQLFNIQIYHERVRIDCINYARKNLHEFLEFVETEEELVDHIEKLEKHMIICGNLEIQMLCRKYKCNITIFDASRQQADHIIKKGNSKVILLCLMNEDHYDAVYQREHIVTAGFCQSIVYKLLYENVFDIQSVDDIVQGMLYDKTYITTQADLLLDEKLQEHEEAEGEKDLEDHKESVVSLPLNIAPFPFKVAKALDPSIYRNIEYDSWTEVRREMRLGDWYYGDDKLILGTRCLFNDKDETYDCYIQDIIKNENKCIVYITKLAQKKVVNYSDLSPENDAKPWPLPYRFSKNLNISATTTILSLDKIKSHRRKKDKNQIKNESGTNCSNPGSDSLDHNVTAYVGAPLQMQNPQNAQEENQEVINEANLDLINQDAQCNTPQRYQWEAPYYSYPGMMTPVIQEPFSWPPTPVSPGVFNFNVRPVMTPVATTPNVMHYCDVNQSPIYNYPMEQYHYTYQPWTQMPESQQTPTSPHPQVTLDINNNKEAVPTPKSQTNETNTQYVPYNENPEYTSVEQPIVCSSVPRVNPQMGMYSPIIPVPPGTPVIYSPTAEIIVPTTPLHMYTPSVEVPYIVPEQYSYPSTPNAAWYPVGVNAQGFIFPTQTVAKQQ